MRVKLTRCQAALLAWLREQPGQVRCGEAGTFLQNAGHLQGEQQTHYSHRCRVGGHVLLALHRLGLAWRRRGHDGLRYGLTAVGRTAIVEVSETQLENGHTRPLRPGMFDAGGPLHRAADRQAYEDGGE